MNDFDEHAAVSGDDDFLLREGLSLLAAYRSIGDHALRASILKTIEAIAAVERDGGAGRGKASFRSYDRIGAELARAVRRGGRGSTRR